LREITLIHPDSPFLYDPKVMPPLGLLYLSAMLKREGVKVHFFDAAGRKKRWWLRSSKFYGITATTPQFPEALKLLQHLKRANPRRMVCIGGPHATLCPEECLDAGFDAVIVGEGDYAIFDFLDGVTGIIEGYVRKIKINMLPCPDRSLVADYEYSIDGRRATTMMTSRGNCPFRCAFCAKTWTTRLRYRDLDSIRAELSEIRLLGYGAVMIYDDEFFLNIPRDYKIMQALSRYELLWRCFTRSTLIGSGLARDAYRHGCREMLLGVESGSNQILENVHKQVTVEDNIRAIKILHQAGIRVKASLIIGLPGETLDTLAETAKFCEQVAPFVSDWDFSLLVPYPGSPIYEHPERYDIKFESKLYAPYKGGKWKAVASTSELSARAITKWRRAFHLRFKGRAYL